MKSFNKTKVYALFFLFLAYPLFKTYQTHHRPLPVFGLLVPEGSEHAIGTQVWLSAAAEEGVPLEVISEETFTNPFQTGQIEAQAILVPDDVSQDASPTLISYLQSYVSRGGKLILVGDALMHELNGRLRESFPAETVFRFPAIQGRVGDTLQLQRDTLRITDEWKKALQIPPGQYTPPDTHPAAFREFSTYQTLRALYPHWQTEANTFTGTRILEAGDGSLVAGLQKIDQGEVLWINLPLGYLKRRTDGLLMHSFLRWIGQDWLALPRLLPVPNGVGGMVLNVHVDSNAAFAYLTRLKDEGFFANGPFSIHVTAGPDTRKAKDGLGFNLSGSKRSQEWIQFWVKSGHQVGSHGGWIHDYFGMHLGETKTPEFEDYLEKNYEAIQHYSGRPPTEYSAPLGNQPIWINDWLRNHGYHSYYFVGDNGMGPTQNYRDDQFTDDKLWSFPIASYRQVASFEEASDQKIPPKEITAWLIAMSLYVSDTRSVRLFYFHPPGIALYNESLVTWIQKNRKLIAKHQFAWYTMDQLSSFLTARSALPWRLQGGDASQAFELVVSGSRSLKEMVWRLPRKSVKNIRVISGRANIQTNGEELLIQAEDLAGFKLQYEEVRNAR